MVKSKRQVRSSVIFFTLALVLGFVGWLPPFFGKFDALDFVQLWMLLLGLIMFLLALKTQGEEEEAARANDR